jgi:lipid-A-disaccharide synthase
MRSCAGELRRRRLPGEDGLYHDCQRESAMMPEQTTIFISAGEASGEHYGALLTAALQRRLEQAGIAAKFLGMGGVRMEAAGLERVVRTEDVAVMGLTEVVRHLPRIYGEYRKLTGAIRKRRPDVAVLIDSPEIHLRLAKEFHRLGIPVIYFVSPQLWAWKKHRIRLVRKYVKRMAVIFPFEEGFYRERGVEAEFVGHPLADLPQPAVAREEFAGQNKLDRGKTWIGLLPGSRAKEIGGHLPEMLKAAHMLAQGANDEYEFIVPLAPTLNREQRQAVARRTEELAGRLTVRLVDDARAALKHSRASLVASGTATVEAALMGNPFVVAYRVSPITYAIAKRMVKVPHVAMVNLIAGRRLVPELIQNDFTAANCVQYFRRLLPDSTDRQSMMQGLATVGDALRSHPAGGRNRGGNAIERVADIVLEQMEAAGPRLRPAAQSFT